MEDQAQEEQIQEQPAAAREIPTPASFGIKDEKEKKKKKIIIALAVAGVVLIVGGFIYFLGVGGSEGDAEASPTPANGAVTERTSSPTPTDSSESVNREDVSIQILNGTGLAGEAGLVRDKLQALGYEKNEVGNASDQDQETTTVTFSSKLPEEIVKEITEELEDTYEDVNAKTGSTGEFDVKIVTGLRKGQTPKPEATATPTSKPEETATPSATPTATP